ncbi:hypothetical protein F4803DRAFT_526327 [Xylaria telfairii]|nr:hypothetical protein F4803DRAFT_526327 [Xylaria telfairii]
MSFHFGRSVWLVGWSGGWCSPLRQSRQSPWACGLLHAELSERQWSATNRWSRSCSPISAKLLRDVGIPLRFIDPMLRVGCQLPPSPRWRWRRWQTGKVSCLS